MGILDSILRNQQYGMPQPIAVRPNFAPVPGVRPVDPAAFAPQRPAQRSAPTAQPGGGDVMGRLLGNAAGAAPPGGMAPGANAGQGGVMNSIMSAFNGGAGGGMDIQKLLMMLGAGG